MNEKPNLADRLGEGRAASIREARIARGWSQAKLAEEAGTSQQTVDRIERGQTLHSRSLDDVMDALGIRRIRRPEEIDEVVQKVRDESRQYLVPQTGPLPVYAMGIDTRLPGMTMLSDTPDAHVDRPGRLQHAPKAYAVSVFAADEMSPAVREGDILFVNPDAPLRLPCEAIFRSADGSVLLRTITFKTDDGWVVEQWQPNEETTLSHADWPVFHPIVGKWCR